MRLIDRLVAASLALLVGAGALYVAVRLIEAVLVPLLITVGLIGGVAGAFVLLRRRFSGGW